MDIIQAIHEERIFKPLVNFENLETWENWFICLKALFALPMTHEEYEIYRKFTARTDRPSKQFKQGFLIVGRRGGKSFISALLAVFLACFKKWNLRLERGHIMIIATDKAQAGVVLDYVKQILQLPVFRSMVVAERAEEIELKNRMTISVHTCSFRSLRGYSIPVCILDELAFWRYEGANPSKEILTALKPSLGGIDGSLLLGISTGYAKRGVLWQAFKEIYGKNDPDCLVWRAGTQDMNPLYDKDAIQTALTEDPTAARAEYFGEFRADLETFLTTEEIDNVVVSGRRMLPPVEGVKYCGFVDPSGGRRDAFALSVAHVEDQKIIQDRLEIRQPPFVPSEVVAAFSRVLKSYNLRMVEGDKYGGDLIPSAFEKEGILYEPTALTKSDIYLESRIIFSSPSRLEILDIEQQTNELRQLDRRTGSQKDKVEHPPTLHDDAANALCGSLVMAATTAGYVRTPGPSRGLIDPINEPEEEKMAKESVNWLLGIKKKKKSKDDPENLDMNSLEAEMMDGLEEEVVAEIRKDSSKGVQFKRGW